MKSTLLFILVIAVSVLASQRRYDGYQVFEVTAKNKASHDVLVKLYNERSDVYDFWTEPRHANLKTDIMVPPAYTETFIRLLQAFDFEYRIKIANVQNTIELSSRDIASPLPVNDFKLGSPRYSLNWTSYSDLPAIYEFINELAINYPQLVTISNAGLSYEGNLMPVVKISTGGTGKNAIFAEAGNHAREWIGPAFITWLMHELVENYTAHPQYVDNIDWYIMPVMNPDGYRYTFDPNGDRLWRKNRSPNAGSPCSGTDLNRNFDFYWNTGGSSGLACADTYHGGSPFSQVEARNVRDAILAVANQTKVYFSFHSYGQYWLTPWGYTSDLPDDYDQLYSLATSAVDKLTAVEGTVYTIGTSTNVLYAASGCSDDWVKGAAGINYSYTVEMRDTGDFGFQLPADQILPNNREVWEGVKVVADAVINM